MSELYEDLAVAYIRGSLQGVADHSSTEDILSAGRAAGLKLHRFKRTMELPRVRAVLGALRNLAPETLLDIGTGRGVFLWPLLDAFPGLTVTAAERDERRRNHLEAVRRGGIDRLRIVGGDAARLDFTDNAFDVVTVLEVLEHQEQPALLARETVRLARRFVIASVPSKPDDNPEHIQLFTAESLEQLLLDAGAKAVRIDFVLNHIIAVARTYEK